MSYTDKQKLEDAAREKRLIREAELAVAIRPTLTANYNITVPLFHVEKALDDWQRDYSHFGGGVEINPYFQRGRVWGEARQIAYIENLLRGNAPNRIIFNCPNWQFEKATGDLPKDTILCVDGLQRLTAVMAYVKEDFRVFDGQFSYSDFQKTSYSGYSKNLTFSMFEMLNHADLLQFYLDLNTGGVVHSDAEIERVKKLLEACKNG